MFEAAWYLAVMDRIVGITRFSWLGLSDWIAARRGKVQLDAAFLAERARVIYDERRLERRFRAFERLCLASLAAQTDKDFIHLVLTSPEMPAAWLARLETLCAKVPQVVLLVTDEREIDAALRPALTELAEDAGRPVLQFRLDDDDALSGSFVARLRGHAMRMSDLPQAAVSLSGGLVVRSYDGAPLEFYRFRRGFASAGAAVRFSAPGKVIFEHDHFRLPQVIPSVDDPTGFNFLLLRWDAADTAARGRGQVSPDLVPIPEARFRQRLAGDFGFIGPNSFDFVRSIAD